MHCERFEEMISDYLDGQLPANERAEFEQHRSTCAECPEVLVQVRSVIELCRAFPEAEPPITLPERILSATLGERRKISLRQYFDLANLKRLLAPQFAVGLALVLCCMGLVVRVTGSSRDGDSLSPQTVISRLDMFTHKIYSEGVRLYVAKNQILAEYNYLKTTLFNQIDYHLSQITGQIKEPAGKSAPAQERNKPAQKEDKKSSLFLFFA